MGQGRLSFEERELAAQKTIITVDGLIIEVARKRVKHVNFTVYPPDGRVRVSAPLRMPEQALHQAIRSKLPWIRRHQMRIANQVRTPVPGFLRGETHDYLGESYRLEVIDSGSRPRVEVGEGRILRLYIRKGSKRDQREHLLMEWYRSQLKTLIPPLIARWEPVIGVKVADWGVKRMKTRWGTCSIQAHRIWLNLELARFPVSHLEYIIVHEMTHLLERRHNRRFYAYLDQFLPGWREIRHALKAASTHLRA